MEYTYTLLYKPTGQKYHGSKYAKDADPKKFWNDDFGRGYYTSSNIINSLIESTGKDSFEVISITEYPDGGAYEAETKFLIENDCANSQYWLNGSNNEYSLGHTDPIFISRMMKKYGVTHNMELQSSRDLLSESRKETWKDPEYGEKIKSTLMKNYGVESTMHSEIIKDRVKSTCIEKYGVENPFAAQEIKDKIAETFFEKYGGHPRSTKEVQDKAKLSCKEKYGVDSYSKTQEFKDKLESTWLNKSIEDKLKHSNASKLARSKDPIMTCEHCGKTMKGNGYIRWHGDKCKMKDKNE